MELVVQEESVDQVESEVLEESEELAVQVE